MNESIAGRHQLDGIRHGNYSVICNIKEQDRVVDVIKAEQGGMLIGEQIF